MNTFELKIWDDEGRKCTFYTVHLEAASKSETDKFFDKYGAIPEFKRATQELLSFVLYSIGQDHGAIDLLFNRYENEVVGLPNKGKVTVGEITFLYPDFPLRLYALRIRNQKDLVVLFNGGVKSNRTNQDSRDISLKWQEACLFAKRIEEALRNKEIIIDATNRKILAAGGSEDIFL